VIGWGAAGVQGPADHGIRWRILAEDANGNWTPFWLVMTGFAWSSVGAPSSLPQQSPPAGFGPALTAPEGKAKQRSDLQLYP
jgi:hypothetical protein